MNKNLYIRRIACVCAVLLVFVSFMGVLVKVQLIDGEEYAAKANTSSRSTVPIKAARGEIVDRNGKPIVQNRQGYSIIFDYSFFPRGDKMAEGNKIIHSLIKLFEQNKTAWINELPIIRNKAGNIVFKADSEKEIEIMKSKDVLNLNTYATAQNCYDVMIEKFEIEGYNDADTLKIMAVRYQMLRNFFSVGSPYTFAEDVSELMVSKVKENSTTFKGVDVEVVPYREYVDGSLAPHIIGYVDKINAEEYKELKDKGYGMNDIIGKSGIEYAMEDYLRGKDGEKVITTDGDGNVHVEVTKEPQQGNTVVLTIDSGMQKVAQDTFKKQAEAYAASSKNKFGVPAAGAVVVNDPNTGEILASVSYPFYDLSTYKENVVSLMKNKRAPLWDRALRSTYAPGSISKPSVGIAAIEEGITDRDRVIHCTSSYKFLDQTYKCQVHHSTRDETLRTALQDSCNTYFFTCGEALGVDRLNEYRSMLGLGSKTGVELTEAEGVLDSPEYRESIGQTWLPGFLIQSSIGQAGNLFTPVQLLNYVATMANGGTRYEQHFVKSVKSSDYSKTILEKNPKVVLETGISQYALDCVTEGMELVVNNTGSKRYMEGMKVQAAAKTGTAEETRKINGVNVDIDNGTYITFAPSHDAQIAMSIVCEGVYGSSYLASIARPIYDYYFESSETADAAQNPNTLLG